MIETVLTEDRIIRITTNITNEARVVDFADIEDGVAYDEFWHEAPWDTCDGWEHEFIENLDHEGYKDAIGYVGWGPNSSDGFIDIDSRVVSEQWGCTGYPGCSKQVRAESIALAKRKATIQLVKWYEHGWEYYIAEASYGDYSDNCGGIDCVEYAEEVGLECRYNVAAQMENDDYIIVNRPERKPYNRVDAFRDRIRQQLDCS